MDGNCIVVKEGDRVDRIPYTNCKSIEGVSGLGTEQQGRGQRTDSTST